MPRRTIRKPMTQKPKRSIPSASRRNFDYPDKTKGSEMAARIRKEASTLKDSDREELLRQGMQIIYSGPGGEKVCSGH